MSTCLDTVIGLSRSTCSCHKYDRPEEYNESDSGLYIDETEGMSLDMIKGAEDCEQGSLWDILDNSRTRAIATLRTDMGKELSKYYDQARKSFDGHIGEGIGKNNLTISSAYHGLKLICAPLKNGYITLSRIGFLFNGIKAGMNWYIYNNLSDTAIASGVITTVANQLTYYTFETPLELPMYSELTECMEYYIIYQNPSPVQPRNNALSCGCNGFTPLCTYPPTIKEVSNAKLRWYEFLNAGGVGGDTVSERDDWSTSTPYTNGLSLDCIIECKGQDAMCDNLRYNSDPAAGGIALALQYKAAEYALDTILKSDSINRYTMTDREGLYARIAHYRTKYDEIKAWLATDMDVEKCGCWAIRRRLNITTV